MAELLTARWMWADAGVVSHGLAKRNPLRWSARTGVADTIRSLEGYRSRHPGRPVKVDVSRSAETEETHGIDSVLQQTYPDVEAAITGLQAYLCAPTGNEPAAGEMQNVKRSSTISDESVSEPLQTLRRHLAGQSTVTVRWMWAKAGPKENPLLWSEWCGLQDTIRDLEAQGFVRSTERVLLQIKSESLQQGSGIAGTVRYETGAGTADAAVVTLKEVLNVAIIIHKRDEGTTKARSLAATTESNDQASRQTATVGSDEVSRQTATVGSDEALSAPLYTIDLGDLQEDLRVQMEDLGAHQHEATVTATALHCTKTEDISPAKERLAGGERWNSIDVRVSPPSYGAN